MSDESNPRQLWLNRTVLGIGLASLAEKMSGGAGENHPTPNQHRNILVAG